MASQEVPASFLVGLLQEARAELGTQLASQLPGAATSARQLLLQHSKEDVTCHVQRALQSPDAKAVVRAVFVASRALPNEPLPAATRLAALRLALALGLVAWVQELPADEGQLAHQITMQLMLELEHLLPSDRIKVLSAAVGALEDAARHCCVVLQLVPPCVALIDSHIPACDSQPGSASAALGTAEAMLGTPTGEPSTAHRDAALHRVLHATWRAEHVGSILSALRGLHMTPEQLRMLMHKAFRACRTADLQLVPGILYQVLQVCSGEGDAVAHSYCLRAVSALFDHLEAQQQHREGQGPEMGVALMQVEATVLMHVDTVLKYDCHLGPGWLKHLKGGGLVPSPYMLQVVFTMCRCHRLEQPLLALLTKLIMRSFEVDARGGAHAWLADTALPGARSVNGAGVEAALLSSIRSSCFATELVAPAVLQLARQLMTTATDAAHLHLVLGGQTGTEPEAAAAPAAAAAHARPAARAVRLGLRLMHELFDRHSDARPEVLAVCQAHLVPGRVEAVLPFVLLLGAIARSAPALLADHVPRLRECLASFGGLAPGAALALLAALWPLCARVRALQDYVVMVLRKVMFGRDTNSRLVAIRGFLFLIVQQLMAQGPGGLPGCGSQQQALADPSQASCSQASLSQMSALSPQGGGLTLLQVLLGSACMTGWACVSAWELLGFLRRALGQQAPVRAALYSGMLQVLDADPAAQECLAAVLQPHLARLLEPDPHALPPLRLALCVSMQGEEPCLVEPLPALLACVRGLAQQHPASGAVPGSEDTTLGLSPPLQPGGEGGLDCVRELQASFADLRQRLLQCSAVEFDLHGQTEFNPLLPRGLANQMHAANLMRVLEVVMEDIVDDCYRPGADGGPLDAASAARFGDELLAAFRLHQRLFELATAPRPSGKETKKRGAGGQQTAGAQPGVEGTQQVGAKRARPSADHTPAELCAPQLTAVCLARLCQAVLADGLVRMPSPCDADAGGYGAGVNGGVAGAGGADPHTALARMDAFRKFVLRSCANYLEACRERSAEAAMTGGGAVLTEWLVLCEPLFTLSQRFILSCSAPLPHPAATNTSGGSGGGGRGARGGARGGRAGSGGGGGDGSGAAGGSAASLELLSARCLERLLQHADCSQQVAALMAVLPLPSTAQSAAVDGGAEAAVAARAPLFTALLSHLMRAGMFAEAEVLCRCLELVGRRGGAAGAAAVMAAAEQACRQQEPEVAHLGLVKALIGLRAQFAGRQDAAVMLTMAKHIQRVIGDASKTTQEDQDQGHQVAAEGYHVPSDVRLAQPASAVLFTRIQAALAEVEGLTGGALALAGPDGAAESRAAAAQRSELLRAVCTRTASLVRPLHVLTNTIMAAPAILELQVRTLMHVYKLLGQLAKLHTPAKGAAAAAAAAAGADGAPPAPSKEFQDMVSEVHRNLTPSIYEYILDSACVTLPSKKAALAAIKREQRVLPQLIFNIEAFEKQLVVASRAFKSSGVNLLRDAKRSTNRDFKVKFPSTAAAAGGQRHDRSREGAGGQRRKKRERQAAPAEESAAHGTVGEDGEGGEEADDALGEVVVAEVAGEDEGAGEEDGQEGGEGEEEQEEEEEQEVSEGGGDGEA